MLTVRSHGIDVTKLSPIVSEFETEEEAAASDAWFRAKEAASLADPRPSVPHEEVVARLAASREKRRNAARRLA